MEMADISWLAEILQLFAYLFVFLVGIGVLWVIALYFVDINQTSHAIRRNYPVVGRFRYVFEHMGEFFRQYFFAQDREEMPFKPCRAFVGIPRRQGCGYHRCLRFRHTTCDRPAP